MKLHTTDVWRLNKGRYDAENSIKEFEYDFGFDSFILNSFFIKELALTFTMIVY